VCPGRKVRVFCQGNATRPFLVFRRHAPSLSVVPHTVRRTSRDMSACGRGSAPACSSGQATDLRSGRVTRFPVVNDPALPAGWSAPARVTRAVRVSCGATGPTLPLAGYRCQAQTQKILKLVSDLQRYRRHVTVAQGFIARQGKCPTCPCGGRLRRGVCAWGGGAIIRVAGRVCQVECDTPERDGQGVSGQIGHIVCWHGLGCGYVGYAG
jgi:hypothetical protein